MNILLLNSQKKNIYLDKLIKILKSHKNDKLIICKNMIKYNFVKKNKINVIISFHYPYLVPKKALIFTNFNAFNFHNSFLPQNRGMYPILWSAVSNNFASCLHKINERIDDGEIIFRKKIKINNNKSLYEAYHLLEKNSLNAFKEKWPKIRNKIKQNKKIFGIKQSRKKITYNNNLKSQILLSNLKNKWNTKIIYVRKTYEIISKLFNN